MFLAFTVLCLDAHTGVEREAPAVFPNSHGLCVFPLKHTTPGQPTQETDAVLGLYFVKRFGAEGAGFVKARRPGSIGLENTLDNDAVKVHVKIRQNAKAVDENDCTDPGGWTRTRTALAHGVFHGKPFPIRHRGRYQNSRARCDCASLAYRAT